MYFAGGNAAVSADCQVLMMMMMMILLVWQPIGWISYKQSTV